MPAEMNATDLGPNKMAIELDGQIVRIEIMCADHYAAIRLHDQISAACRQGQLNLTVNTDETLPEPPRDGV